MSIGERPTGPGSYDRSTAETQASATTSHRLRARLAANPLLRAIARADHAGTRWLRRQARNPQITGAIRAYSHLGEHGTAWIVLGAVGAAIDRRRRRDWLIGLGGVGAAYLANTTLKQVARRPRPAFDDLPPLIATPGPLSFPSSHSASSAAAITGYSLLLPRTPLALAAATMAISRIHLGVHYPSDIIAGASLGTLVARLTRRLANRHHPATR
ncbi:MAG: phosphatase PAP2 family protein [Patulibacter sp.]